EVAEHDVGGAELVGDARERHRRIRHVHQVDVAGQDHLHGLGPKGRAPVIRRYLPHVSIFMPLAKAVASSVRSMTYAPARSDTASATNAPTKPANAPAQALSEVLTRT